MESILGIYASLSSQDLKDTIKQFSGKNFSEFKENLSELVVEKINPISKEIKGLLDDEVDGIDVFEVYNQSKNLLEDVRKGKPAFLKVNSYRFHGHARMDKSPYRDQQRAFVWAEGH